MRRDVNFRRDEGANWVYYRSSVPGRSTNKERFKLRINLPAECFQHYKNGIIGFLCKHSGAVLRSFKMPTERCANSWSEQGIDRFNSNGQFTLYLLEPYDPDAIQDFIRRLQDYLTNTLEAPVAEPMATDFALTGCGNVSMRLDHADAEYVASDRLSTDEYYATAHRNLTQDMAFYARFAEGAPERAIGRNDRDMINRLLLVGFRCVADGDVQPGLELQKTAIELREALFGVERPSNVEVQELLLKRYKLLAELGLYSEVKGYVAEQMGLTAFDCFELDVRCCITKNLELIEARRGSVMRVFSSTAPLHSELSAARKLLRYAKNCYEIDCHNRESSTQMLLPYLALKLTQEEKAACVSHSGALRSVIRQYGYSEVVERATIVRPESKGRFSIATRLVLPVGRG